MKKFNPELRTDRGQNCKRNPALVLWLLFLRLHQGSVKTSVRMEIEAFQLKFSSGRCWGSSKDTNFEAFVMILRPGAILNLLMPCKNEEITLQQRSFYTCHTSMTVWFTNIQSLKKNVIIDLL